ncbi:hypothetical protein [Streptomyces sp. ADI92-24]|uniref:hypothetical protein n=1 Tax=Streptomyces sp. ADI92-24 TaxID=1522756 RepID=UPI0013DDD4FC|nr:hypothetical protein [Streptomyces sp. ADI92-24]
MASATSFGALQRSCVPQAGASGDDVQAAGLRVERHGLDPPGELGHDRREDGVEVGEDASAGDRGGHAALGHHHADRAAQPERLTAVTSYGGSGAPVRLLTGRAVLLRRFPGREQGLAREVDAGHFAAAHDCPQVE